DSYKVLWGSVFDVRLFDGSFFFFFSSRRRHTRSYGDWSSDVCSSDLVATAGAGAAAVARPAVMPTATAIRRLSSGEGVSPAAARSEERRVGKECRSRWSPDH